MAEDSIHVVTLDIGGSHVTAAVVNVAERSVVPGSVVTRHVGHDSPGHELIEHWAKAAAQASRQSGMSATGHVGVAIPGPFDFMGGVSLHEHKFQALRGRNVGYDLQGAWRQGVLARARVSFVNDADAFALGEAWAGEGRGHERVIGVTLGTGLGSGFVERGRIVTEGPGVPNAGELWNLPYRDGIAEDYVSTRALRIAYAQKTREVISPADIASRAAAGDEAALQTWREFGDDLARILESVERVFAPSAVLLGGNISRAWTLFREPLQQRFGTLCQPSALLRDAPLLGAACHVLTTAEPYERLRERP